MPRLFEDDDQDSDFEIKPNTEYATHYNTWRQKEELNKLKTKYGDIAINADDESDEESSSSDEDEDGTALTEEFDKDFFKTLSCLKKKDPKIYDKNVKFFKDDSQGTKKNFETSDVKKGKKKDPLLLKNYEKKMLLKTGGKFEDSSDEEENYPQSVSPTYVEEQEKLKETFKKALDDDDDDDNWGGMFHKREKTKAETEKEEDEYTQWLKGQKSELTSKETEAELEPLKNYWDNPKLGNDEAFLRDYLLNRRYLEKEDKDYIPSYEEIVHDSDEGLSEDEKNIENQEEFETKYNHRFEEPDVEYIKRYPRTMANSVRKTDDRRKLKRAEIKTRKEEEKKRQQEDLKQLKALKRKEIEEKIKKLKEITGNDDLAFNDDDLEEDFDPELYDKRMQQLFSEEYYEHDEAEQKPEFPDLAEELGPWGEDYDPHCEDENFIMDCDYDPNAVPANKEQSKKKRTRYDKKGNKIEKTEFDENDKRFEKFADELYQLDYEDMIGDLPCRFKYREVVPNSFGLTVEEILIAKDRELNRWSSLKKAVQHRPEHVEKYEVIAYKKKGTNEILKRKILGSIFEELEEPKEDENIKINKKRISEGEDSSESTTNVGENTEEISKKEKKKRGKKDNTTSNDEVKRKKNNMTSNDEDKLDLTETDVSSMEIIAQKVLGIAGEENNDQIHKTERKKGRKKPKVKLELYSEQQITQVLENQEVKATTKIMTDDENSEDTNTLSKLKKKKQTKLQQDSVNEEEFSIDADENLNDKNKILVEGINVTSDKSDVFSSKKNKKKRKLSDTDMVENQNVVAVNTEENVQKQGKLTRRQRKNKKKLMQNAQMNKKSGNDDNGVSKKLNRKRKLSEQHMNAESPTKKVKTSKYNKNKGDSGQMNISDSRLQAYGINPKKFKNKLKYKKN